MPLETTEDLDKNYSDRMKALFIEHTGFSMQDYAVEFLESVAVRANKIVEESDDDTDIDFADAAIVSILERVLEAKVDFKLLEAKLTKTGVFDRSLRSVLEE